MPLRVHTRFFRQCFERSFTASLLLLLPCWLALFGIVSVAVLQCAVNLVPMLFFDHGWRWYTADQLAIGAVVLSALGAGSAPRALEETLFCSVLLGATVATMILLVVIPSPSPRRAP